MGLLSPGGAAGLGGYVPRPTLYLCEMMKKPPASSANTPIRNNHAIASISFSYGKLSKFAGVEVIFGANAQEGQIL